MQYLVLNTSNWKKLQPLATIAHFILDKLQTEHAQLLFGSSTGQRFITEFQKYYQIPQLDLVTLQHIFAHYPHPSDAQMLWMPVLKQICETELKLDLDQHQLSIEQFLDFCQRLHISVKGVLKNNKQIKEIFHHAPKSALTVLVEISPRHIKAMTAYPKKAHRHQLQWRHGVPRLSFMQDAEIKAEVKQLSKSDHDAAFNQTEIEALIQKGKFSTLAKLLHQNINRIVPSAVITKAIEKFNLQALITLYQFNNHARSQIVNTLLKGKKNDLLSKIFYYQEQLSKLPATELQQWRTHLQTLLLPEDVTIGDTDLHRAIRRGDDDFAIALIEAGAAIDHPNDAGVTPLHLAFRGQLKLVQAMHGYLTKQDKQKPWYSRLNVAYLPFTIQDKNGETPVHYAAKTHSVDVVTWFASTHRQKIAGISLTALADKQGRTPLHHAVMISDVSLIDAMNSTPTFNVDMADKNGMTALHYAIMFADVKTVKALIDAGASVETMTNSPLILLLDTGRVELFEVMMTKMHQLVHRRNSEGMNAIHVACFKGEVNLIKHWVARFGKTILDQKCAKGRMPVHYAVMGGQIDMLNYLQAMGANLQSKDHEGLQPLHMAARYNQSNMVEVLSDALQDNFDANVKTNLGETPYALAALAGHAQFAAELEKHGAEPQVIIQLIIDDIYRNQEQGSVNLAGLLEKYPQLAQEVPTKDGNNLFQHCVKAGNLLAARVVLHPLTAEERQAACQHKNKRHQTAYQILKSMQIKKPEPKELWQKFERLIAGNDPALFQKKYTSIIAKARFYEAMTSDLKEQFSHNSWYRRLTTASIYYKPAWDFVTGTVAGGPWVGAVNAFNSFMSGDNLDKLERSFMLLNDIAPEPLPAITSYAQSFFWGVGLWRHTASRLSVAVVREVAAHALRLGEHQFNQKNYFTALNYMSASYFLCEEFGGRQLLTQFVQQYFVSIEDELYNRYNFPTIQMLTMSTEEVTKRATDFIDETVMPVLSQVNDAQKQTLGNYLRDYLVEHHLEGKVAYQNVVALVNFINGQPADEAAVGALVNICLVQQDQAAACVGDFLAQSALLAPYNPSRAQVNAYNTEIAAILKPGVDGDQKEMVAAMQGVLTKIPYELIMAQFATNPNGVQVHNDYMNILNNNHIKPCNDGRSQYLAERLISGNLNLLSGLTPEQRKQLETQIRAYIYNNAHNASNIIRAITSAQKNFDRYDIFIKGMIVTAYYFNGLPLTPALQNALSAYNDVDLRASLAVHELNQFLNNTPGYQPLSVNEQLSLFNSIIDDHSRTNGSKKIQDSIAESINQHALIPGDYQLLMGSMSIDEAASFITASSKNGAEFNWPGSAGPARTIKISEPSTINKIWHTVRDIALEVANEASKENSVGLNSDGSKPQLALFNKDTGQVVSLDPSPKMEFTLGNFNTTQTAANRAGPVVLYAQPNFAPVKQSEPMNWMERNWQVVLHQQASWQHDPIYAKEFTKLMKSTLPPKRAPRKIGESRHKNETTVVTLEPPVRKTGFKQFLTEAAVAVLNKLIDPAEAYVPAVVNANMVAAGAAAGTATTFPVQIWIDHFKNVITGKDPFEREMEEYEAGFPLHEASNDSTITQIEQPNAQTQRYTLPLIARFPLLAYYKKRGDASSGVTNQKAPDEVRIYDDTYPKHMAGKNGEARWPGASVNPIRDSWVGQQILDSAYKDPTKKNQLFNYYNGKLIRFHSSNDHRWHCYAVDEKVENTVGSPVLKTMLKDGLITKAEYKKLLKL